MRVFKIRNKATGLYAAPVRYSPWSDKGKVFARINHARASWAGSDTNCEIVEFALTEVGAHQIGLVTP